MDLDELRCKPIAGITFNDVVAFCGQQERENIVLDYKAKLSGRSPGKQVAKLVAAFANTQGGIAIWGVAEQDGRPEPHPEGMDLGKDPLATIRNACARLVVPPMNVETSDYLKNPDMPDRGFLVVRVPQGELVPYTCDNIIY